MRGIVEDDGPGFPPGMRAHIFQRFRRLDREHSEGSGLGLAIVSELATALGGGISVTDRAGGGLRVMIDFPRDLAGGSA